MSFNGKSEILAFFPDNFYFDCLSRFILPG